MSKTKAFKRNTKSKVAALPIAVVLDKSVSDSELERARKALLDHGSAKLLNCASDYVQHTLMSLLAAHYEHQIWYDKAYMFIEYPNQMTALQASIEAKLSGDCVISVVRFCPEDQKLIAETYRRMQDFANLRQALDSISDRAMSYCYDLRQINGENARVPDFSSIQTLRANIEAEADLFNAELGRIVASMNLSAC